MGKITKVAKILQGDPITASKENIKGIGGGKGAKREAEAELEEQEEKARELDRAFSARATLRRTSLLGGRAGSILGGLSA